MNKSVEKLKVHKGFCLFRSIGGITGPRQPVISNQSPPSIRLIDGSCGTMEKKKK